MYALQYFYFPSPIHSRFINKKVLHRYMPVGGVRIEDDILITSQGYENLTKAPKGDAMFDIIRGRKSTSNTAQKQNANPPIGIDRTSLFRAPGCPVQTTPPGIHPIKHAAIMPNQTRQCQSDEDDRRNHPLHFRRSMTTDECVQHWRQSHLQVSPQSSMTIQEKPNTVCGTLRDDFKHILIGDGCFDTSNTHNLPQCTDCAILTQTLGRLRQNLALSKQGSPAQTHSPQNTVKRSAIETAYPHSAREKPTDPSQRTVETSVNATQRNSHPRPVGVVRGSRPIEQARAMKSSLQMLQSQDPHPKQLHAAFFTAPEDSSWRDPESYYRIHEQCQNPVGQRLSARHTGLATQAQNLRSHMSLPTRVRMTEQKERRRPSNHTDDRDWMA